MRLSAWELKILNVIAVWVFIQIHTIKLGWYASDVFRKSLICWDSRLAMLLLITWVFLFSKEIQGKYHLRPIADKIKNLSLEREVSLFDGYGATCEICHRRNLDVSFRLYQWPEALINELVKHIRNFIWSGDSKHMKLIMVSWMKICRPLSEGGPGLRSLKAINKASILSLTWKFISSADHWAELMRARVLKDGFQVCSYTKSSLWSGIKQFWNTVCTLVDLKWQKKQLLEAKMDL